ncbi:MAG TPA: hypothetical protein VN969_27090, partial [Streptosporangiaceae bacterium]|nr:hypothetical protein [Streptosporangiaceae bacterium]
MPVRRLAGRTLSTRLIAGVMLLLAGACAIIGVVTYLAVRNSMVSSVDGQLQSATGNYASCITMPRDPGAPGGGGIPRSPGGGPGPNSAACIQGQQQGMLGVQISGSQVIERCSVVAGMRPQICYPSATDTKALLALHTTGSQPPNAAVYDLNLASLGGEYRLTAITAGGYTLVTGLPMGDVTHTLGQVAIAELIVFLSVLLLAAVLSTFLVRVALRPLRR